MPSLGSIVGAVTPTLINLVIGFVAGLIVFILIGFIQKSDRNQSRHKSGPLK